MISIRSSAAVALPASRVWALFREMERHYLDWHPEHLGWEDVRGHATEPGSIVFAEERVGSLRLRARFFIDEAVPERRFTFHLGFPFSLLNAGGSFELAPEPGGGCRLEAETHFGPRRPLAARLVDPLLRRVLPPSRLDAHMEEEGARLARLATRPALDGAPRASQAITATVRVVVARPVDEVFDFFADLRNEPLYNGQVGAIVKTSPGPISAGTTFEGQHRGLGRVSWRLSGWARPSWLVIDGVVAGGRYRWVTDLQPHREGTELVGRMAWELPRWLRLLRPLLQRVMQWNARRSFRRFKAVLEAASA